jgi:hypothetical protein
MLAMFLNHMTHITQSFHPKTEPTIGLPQPKAEKTKRGRKKHRTSNNNIANDDEEDDDVVLVIDEPTTSENSYRRLNWQKGRQDWSRPSKVKAEIDKVTVDTLPEIYPKLKKHGWAILRDCNNAFAPKSRFTRDQMEYINQCTSNMYS